MTPTQSASPRSRVPAGDLVPRPRGPRRRRLLIGLELGTGAAALVGGVLLAVAPDGSLLRIEPALLQGSPFTDWRLPGLALAGLVGGGFLTAGAWERRNRRYAQELSILVGLGLIAFEVTELVWIGFQPLEGVFALVGAVVLALATAGRQQ